MKQEKLRWKWNQKLKRKWSYKLETIFQPSKSASYKPRVKCNQPLCGICHFWKTIIYIYLQQLTTMTFLFLQFKLFIFFKVFRNKLDTFAKWVHFPWKATMFLPIATKHHTSYSRNLSSSPIRSIKTPQQQNPKLLPPQHPKLLPLDAKTAALSQVWQGCRVKVRRFVVQQSNGTDRDGVGQMVMRKSRVDATWFSFLF